MGKSFNDDVFNNDFNFDSINGLNISKEAIEENKEKNKLKIDLDNINLDEIKEKIKDNKEKQKSDPRQEYEELIQEQERIKEKQKEYEQMQEQEDKAIYVKKTMIFKQEYLDIIDGLATINDMQIKDVLNQLLSRAISELDIKVKDKALKTGKKGKSVKTEKNIF